MPFEIEFDLRDVERAIEEADDELRRLPGVAVRLAAEEGLADAKARRRYKDRTGQLTNSAIARMVGLAGTGAESEIVWPVPYASYVDAGTPAHVIRPKLGGGVSGPLQQGQTRTRGPGGTVLTFQIGGRWVSTPQVNHPGTRAYAFAGDAYRKAEAVLLREVEVSAAKATAILSR